MSDQPRDVSERDDSPEDKALVEEYRQLVLEYERLDETIDALLTANDGGTEKMSDDDFSRYRQLAAQRDEIYDRIKALESTLFSND